MENDVKSRKKPPGGRLFMLVLQAISCICRRLPVQSTCVFAENCRSSQHVHLQEIAGACDIVHLQKIAGVVNNVYLQ